MIAFHLYPSMRAEAEGCVSHLFVHSRARGKGAGRKLLAAAEQEAATRGCNRLLLYINRSRPAYVERSFYTKVGWQEQEGAALFVRRVGRRK